MKMKKGYIVGVGKQFGFWDGVGVVFGVERYQIPIFTIREKYRYIYSKYTYFRVIIYFVEKRQRRRIIIKLKNKLKWE